MESGRNTSLSQYYQLDIREDSHPNYDFVNADVQLDPEGKDLPWNHIVEIWAISDDMQRQPLWEATKERGTLVKELTNVTQTSGASQSTPKDEEDPTI